LATVFGAVWLFDITWELVAAGLIIGTWLLFAKILMLDWVAAGLDWTTWLLKAAGEDRASWLNITKLNSKR
jgi:hypothetical protein